MRCVTIIIGVVLLCASLASVAPAQPPPVQRSAPSTCRAVAQVTGACHWVSGTFSAAPDASTLKQDGSGKSLWVELVRSDAMFPDNARPFFGPDGEGVHGRFEVCPVLSHSVPWGNGTGPALCINSTSGLAPVPLPEEFYRQRPDLRARWEAFLKARAAHPKTP